MSSCTIPISLTVCNYNLGTGARDYYSQCLFLNPNLVLEQKQLVENYNKAQKQTAEELCKVKLYDVYFLQEVIHKTRPLIDTLIEKKFQIFHEKSESGFDTLIALNGDRFINIQSHLINVIFSDKTKINATIAVAKDILTGYSIAFASAHAPGFDFNTSNLDKETISGDTYCQSILEKIEEVGKGCIKIIGADLNASPEKWQKRFDIFLKNGFNLMRLNKPTNVNPSASNEKVRELDFILYKMESATKENLVTYPLSTPFEWNMITNASDHLPIIGRFKFIMTSPAPKDNKDADEKM